ncbi:MAG: ORF6N domain-containing protein [Verrucomicrobia bacterium]|nr:ORF6N domain-containing protein [Verrucomicrobiota bacterium]MBU4247579.1 ORF6N domain-containing protein [Verrucomicrobiota bacterium]MBU4291193.1 ORF6N domain-containing protein [Verrucomicrobiota bacterium]MBU4428464.1 ORF6N domain-containing protein [Verrucomicrobiota bacterium]MBU4496838.1 ORF6N domain-containing protein [Verrucomicrobiota bacterium]
MASTDRIQQAIRLYQGHKVMLDFDLASLYGVTTGALNRQVKRNRDRFPPDFVYEIDAQDVARLICQNGISKPYRGGRRKPVLAFTQEGVAMLSSVLHSDRAVRVNVEIMRAFVHLRSLLAAHAELALRLDELEKRYDEQFRAVFDAIRELMAPPEPPQKRIGFHVHEKSAAYRVSGKGRRRHT